MTDPPMVGAVGLAVARRFRVPLVVVCQDVFPETAASWAADEPVAVGMLRQIVGSYLRRADRIVSIGETMSERLVAKGARRQRVASSRTGSTRRRSPRSPGTTVGAERTASSAASSSCTRATLATPRIRDARPGNTRCATSTASRSSCRLGARHADLFALAARRRRGQRPVP